MPFEIKVTLTSISQTDLKSNYCLSQRLFMPEWKALNVGVESEDVAQDQNPKFVRVNSMFNVFEVLSKLTTELYPENLSLTHFYMYIQDTREDNNGLPVVVFSYLRMHRCFHRMYAPKNCLRSCTEKKRMLTEFYPPK